jgi:hypothetical protein
MSRHSAHSACRRPKSAKPEGRFDDPRTVRVGIQAPLRLTLLPECSRAFEFATERANQCKLFSNELRQRQRSLS